MILKIAFQAMDKIDRNMWVGNLTGRPLYTGTR